MIVVADTNMLKLLEAILLLHLHQQMHAKCMSKFLKVSIDCKHFDFGNGNCPFGSSCFYKHKVKPVSYTWRHHRPPPRRSGFVDDLFDMFNSIEELTASETALNPMEELTSLEMALLLRDLILDTSDSSSDEEDFYSP
ncbi:uncharacterized protein LOC126724297 isoform X7 [Quercus robur]|nr:uncharacterized protein LOC126724297 isoform X7 [Quercus robur]XP_050284855.1 uncharacterized protein LOC126724297 isoform X7 [Quercus robur]